MENWKPNDKENLSRYIENCKKLENFIEKYGEEEGRKKFKKVLEKQYEVEVI